MKKNEIKRAKVSSLKECYRFSCAIIVLFDFGNICVKHLETNLFNKSNRDSMTRISLSLSLYQQILNYYDVGQTRGNDSIR